MLDQYQPRTYETLELEYVGVKAPQFSYSRLKGSNPVAHVEMASTGEVACLGEDLKEAFFNAWLATDQAINKKSLLVSIAEAHKEKLLGFMKLLDDAHWEIYSTEGTHDYLTKNGIGSYFVHKVSEKHQPNITDIIANRKVDLIINIPSHKTAENTQKTDGYILRRMAIDHHIPLITNLQTALIILQCLVEQRPAAETIRSWQDFMALNKKTV
jgi:methylglyoxal synthase